MKFLKPALIAIVVFALLLLAFSWLLPSKINVSKSTLIHASKEQVTAALLDIEQWKNWNPILQDPGIQYLIESPHRVKWTSAKGVPNVIQLEPYTPDSIHVIIRSDNKPVFTSGFTVTQHPEDSLLIKVEWWIREDLRWYPWQKFYGLFSESFREAYMEDNLRSLKYYLENK
ncbi:MAG: SRPBCC family protein [Chitinophagaceae bacterium]|nr:SRPBCC family protein [Chitinophagaceae bacterium]